MSLRSWCVSLALTSLAAKGCAYFTAHSRRRRGQCCPEDRPLATRKQSMRNQLFVRITPEALLFMVVSSLTLTAGSGCQKYAKITWDSPKPVPVENKTRLAVSDLAELKLRGEAWDEGRPAGVIGRHTWTVFAIPGPFLYLHDKTPLKESFAKAIREALTAAGYELYDVAEASQAAGETNVLRGEVNACWWWSYTWLWPFVLQGGQNKVTLFLENSAGDVLWKKTFSRIEPGFPVGGAYAFGTMIKWSMTKLVQDIVRACSSEDFKSALRGGS